MADKIYKSPLDQINDIQEEQPIFTPTKETIWNDPNHPLYGIAPSEQNVEFLQEAVNEIARKTQSPTHWRFYGGNQGGGTRLDAIKKMNQYKKAIAYIKNGGK